MESRRMTMLNTPTQLGADMETDEDERTVNRTVSNVQS